MAAPEIISKWRSAVAGVMGLAAATITVAPALADDAQSVIQEAGHTHSSLVPAGDFGLADGNNIGMIIYYGTGNGSSPEDVAAFLISKLDERLNERIAEDPTLMVQDIDVEYYITNIEQEGIGVAYMMGGMSVGPVDINQAFTPETLNQVLENRENTARLLADAGQDATIELAQN